MLSREEREAPSEGLEIRIAGPEALLTPLAKIRLLAESLGREPSAADYRQLVREDPSLPSMTVLYHLVGPWPQVLETAGVKQATPASGAPQALRAYDYRAFDEEVLETGEIVAVSVEAAHSALAAEGLDVVSLLPHPPQGDREQWSQEEMMDYALEGLKAMRQMDLELADLVGEAPSAWWLSKAEWRSADSEDGPEDTSDDLAVEGE
jgi:hypothetical protein